MAEIWYKDIFGFFDDYREFVPRDGMTFNQKLNSVVRLALYVSMIHFLMFNETSVFTVTACTMIVTILYHYSKRESYSNPSIIRPADKHKLGKDTAVSELQCTKPKKENPFMNVLINEYTENPGRNPACDVEDGIVKKRMDDSFHNDDTYREIDDVFDRKTSFRQFHTMPNTQIPNKQDHFAKWLYDTGESYKEGNGTRHKNFADYY